MLDAVFALPDSKEQAMLGVPLVWPCKWVDADGVTWLVALGFARVGSARVECVAVEIRSFAVPADRQRGLSAVPVRPVSAALLRQVPIGQLVRDAREQLVSTFTAGELDDAARNLLGAWAVEDSRVEPGSLADVARTYVLAWQAGASPTEAVAREFGLSHSGAAKRVARARAAGLLPKTTQGRAVTTAPSKASTRKAKR